MYFQGSLSRRGAATEKEQGPARVGADALSVRNISDPYRRFQSAAGIARHDDVQARPREGEWAGVAKLEYARDLGSRSRETVRVRVPPSAPRHKNSDQHSAFSDQKTKNSEQWSVISNP
jgi:hypothetical protein